MFFSLSAPFALITKVITDRFIFFAPRQTVLISMFCCLVLFSNAQPFTLRAQYQVQYDPKFTYEKDGKKAPLLDLLGLYFIKGNRVISYYKPLYVGKYPGNQFIEEVGPNQYRTKGLNTDSIIAVTYSDGDSLIFRYTNFSSEPNMQRPESFYYEPGFKKWEILNEFKEINGLQCQRAKQFDSRGGLQWDVWFCADIPVPRGFDDSFDIPGLLVEAVFIDTYFIKLRQYETGIEIDDKEFWPPIFNKSFFHRGTIKNKHKAN